MASYTSSTPSFLPHLALLHWVSLCFWLLLSRIIIQAICQYCNHSSVIIATNTTIPTSSSIGYEPNCFQFNFLLLPSPSVLLLSKQAERRWLIIVVVVVWSPSSSSSLDNLIQAGRVFVGGEGLAIPKLPQLFWRGEHHTCRASASVGEALGIDTYSSVGVNPKSAEKLRRW